MLSKRVLLAIGVSLLSILVFLYRGKLRFLYFESLSYITKPDLNYIKTKTWSYASGFRPKGDFIIFEGRFYNLHNDTILYNHEPVAIIERLNKEYFEMIVGSLDGEYKGVFVNTEERLN